MLKLRTSGMLLAVLLVWCAGSAQGRDALAAENMKAPWSLSYHDGSGNNYRFWQDSEGCQARFEYSPVRPEGSSSGVYSGGDARQGRLDGKTEKELQQWIPKLDANGEPQGSARKMGTGAVSLKSSAGTRDFIVKDGPLLHEFNQFLLQFRNEPSKIKNH